MLRLREEFSPRIHLHIKQDMLQKLWDKYVPAESSEYKNIQLIYLDGGAGQASGQPGQLQLLISLVLKNRMMRMGLEGYPVKTALVREQMGNSLRRMEKYYLMQLKCCDFIMFRKVSRYVDLLTQAEVDGRRYRNWHKDDQIIEQQRDRYRLFSLFSSDMKEFLAEHTVQAMRTLEKEMLYDLSEKEYWQLSERFIWQEKETFLSFLENCNEEQCSKIIKRLEKTGLRKSAQLLKGQPAGRAFAEAADRLGQKEFCLFYRQAAGLEDADRQLVIWKEKKEKMLSYIEEQESEKVRQIWTQMEKFVEQKEWTQGAAAKDGEDFFITFSEKLVQLEEQYFREVMKDFREQTVSMLRTEKFETIADMAEFLREGLEKKSAEENEMSSGAKISWITERIESELKLQKEQIERREAQIFLKYQKEYQEVLESDQPFLQAAGKEVQEVKDMLWQIAGKEPVRESAQIDGEKTAEISYEEVWEWGKALFFYLEHRQRWTDADILPDYTQNKQLLDHVLREDMQILDHVLREDMQLSERVLQEDRRMVLEQEWGGRRPAAAYPRLVLRIREFEEQRNKRIQKIIRSFENKVLSQDAMIYLEERAPYSIGRQDRLQMSVHRGSAHSSTGYEDIWDTGTGFTGVRRNGDRTWELQYSIQNAGDSEAEQQRDKMRMQEETHQLRSAQEQIDKKLQEVEVQLRKLETTARAKEDVRDLADKVKRQLYEELHVEKLRRGLV